MLGSLTQESFYLDFENVGICSRLFLKNSKSFLQKCQKNFSLFKKVYVQKSIKIDFDFFKLFKMKIFEILARFGSK
jgi:hypothetical protein